MSTQERVTLGLDDGSRVPINCPCGSERFYRGWPADEPQPPDDQFKAGAVSCLDCGERAYQFFVSDKPS